MQKILRIVTVVLTCLVVGYLSGQMNKEGLANWYPTLVKPVFNPPNWVFVPVWSLLYVMMGVAGGMIWNCIETDESNVKKAFLLFVAQLGLNVLWSYLFFVLHNPMLALIEIILLWLLIFETYTHFRKIEKVAGMLLVPYLAWVSFAVVLNGSIWWLNR
ncbi:MAG: TspO/MBR family protein [Flavobacterium sp.]